MFESDQLEEAAMKTKVSEPKQAVITKPSTEQILADEATQTSPIEIVTKIKANEEP